MPLHGSEEGKPHSLRNVMGIVPAPVPVVPAVCMGVAGMSGAVIMLFFEAPKCDESALKTITIGHRQLLHKRSIPKVAVCNLVLTKE